MNLFDKFFKNKKWIPYTIATCSAVVLYLLLNHISYLFKGISAFFGIIKPVLLAIVLAYVMDPIARWFEKTCFRTVKNRHVARQLAITLDVVTVVFIFAMLVWALIPQVLQSLVGFIENNVDYAKNLENMLAKMFGDKFDIETFSYVIETILSKVAEYVSKYSNSIVSKSTEYVSGLMNGIIAFILAIYFLSDKKKILEWFKKVFQLLLNENYEHLENFFYRCNRILIRYIECDVIDAIIVGITNWIFMTIMQMPYAILVSVVVGVTNLAPTFGPIVGGVIGAFILVMVKPWYAILFLFFTIILQTIDGYVIKPKLFGSTLGVSSLWILISIVIGGRLFGVIGILMAIPFAAIVQYIIKEILFPQENIREFLEGNREPEEDS